jgi:4'-phosphopantetheinyl transferase EntD
LTPTTASSLPVALSALCGPDVVVESAPPQLVSDQLFPEERQYIERAVESRQAQFGTARLCARRALARLGIAPCPLVPNTDRSPSWPEGVRGSIAHTASHCAVAVTQATHVRGIGLDLEADGPLNDGLDAVICTAAERAWIAGFDSVTRAWLVPLVFSAKEAFYKCQYPLTRARLGFEDVQLSIDPGAGTFSITDLAPHVPERSELLGIVGRFCRLERLLVTAAILVK